MVQDETRSLGWEVLKQARVLVTLAAVALVCLVAGGLSAHILGSSPTVREPVKPGLITARVEGREIRSVVVARADVSFAEPVEVNPSVPEGATAPVVTGRVPKVGDVVESGTVVLEVSGRPVFALAGKFPFYRSLSAGLTGPDVTMLRKALKGLGYDAGETSDVYDAALAGAVARLYADHGYAAPSSGDRSSRLAVRDAEDSLEDAKSALSDAKRAVTRAKADLAGAKKQVSRAKSELSAAQQALAQADSDPEGSLKAAVDAARTELASAQSAVTSAKDEVTAAQTGVTGAERTQTRAREALSLARQDALTPLPASEVVFLNEMPRRVDVVNVRLGDVIGATAPASGASPDDASSAALVLSGNTIQVVAQVPVNEASLVRVDAPVDLLTPDDVTVRATVSSVCPEASASGDPSQRCAVGIKLGELDEVDRSGLLGNVQVTIQVGVTSPDALVVPLAAVSADAAGRARVQRVVPGTQNDDPMDPANLEWVSIEPGLSAEGMVEIKTSDPALAVGDLVVLGIAGTRDEPSPAETPQ